MSELIRVADTAAVGVSDEELVRLILQHDESALTILIQRYGGQIHSICKCICCDELEASAVVSDVFWEFWRHADFFQSNRGSLRSYLLTMARSRSIDRMRSVTAQSTQRSKFIEATLGDTKQQSVTDSPEQQVMNSEDAEVVQHALGQLSELQRQMLQMAFFEGMSHREVADILQIPLGTVKTHIRKGLLRLRFLLSELSQTGRQS